VTAGDFLNMKIPVPGFAEQRKIAEFLNISDREIEGLCRELDALKEQKKGLMQQLLTGKVRVGG
jgi:type I restriction enzyme S subunit